MSLNYCALCEDAFLPESLSKIGIAISVQDVVRGHGSDS